MRTEHLELDGVKLLLFVGSSRKIECKIVFNNVNLMGKCSRAGETELQ